MADPAPRSSDDEKTIHNENETRDTRSASLIAKQGPLDEHGMVAVSAKLKNPLSGMTKDELLADVEAFAREKDLEDILPLLQRGSLVAQNPKNFENVSELTEDEKMWLRKEITNRWQQPKMMFYMTSELPSYVMRTTLADFDLFSSLCWFCYRAGHRPDCRQWCSNLLF